MKVKKTNFHSTFILVMLLFPVLSASADILCIKNKAAVNKNGKVKTRTVLQLTDGNCPRGFSQILDTAVFAGATGEQGPAGAQGQQGAQGPIGNTGLDGAIRVYGDGTDGDLMVSSDLDYDDGYSQFEDITVDAGQTLTVPHGTVLRCTGSATINGTIEVSPAPGSAAIMRPYTGAAADLLIPSYSSARVGLPLAIARNGQLSAAIGSIAGGPGGGQLEANMYENIRPGVNTFGGGGGVAGPSSGAIRTGGAGGGSLAIICAQGITISGTGTISAPGQDAPSPCSGGGAGGIIFMYSGGIFTQLGTLSVPGGNGADGADNCAAGGGGGGGLIVRMSLGTLSFTGPNIVAGGVGGNSQGIGLVNQVPTAGGGGGGGNFGVGGAGGAVAADGSSTAGNVGTAGGAVIAPLVDPVSFLLGS